MSTHERKPRPSTQSNITITVTVVMADGTEVPYEPGMLDGEPLRPSQIGTPKPAPEKKPWKWPKSRGLDELREWERD